MTELERLQDALEVASNIEFELSQEHGRRKSELWEQVRTLEASLKNQLHSEFKDRINRASTVRHEAQSAVNAERVRIAHERAEYPLGVKLYHWKREDFRFGPGKKEFKLSGKIGIYEVFKPGDPLPDNLSDWTRPKPGDLIVRIAKKDGKPGRHIDKRIVGMFGNEKKHWNKWGGEWLPEGETPKEETV